MDSRQSVKLKEILAEASQALAHVDAERLDEISLYCQALLDAPATCEAEARNAANEMAVFSHVLEATRANLRVMRRLRELRATDAGSTHESAAVEAEYGHD
jgi:hypothetical protein